MTHQPATIRRIWLSMHPSTSPGRLGLTLSPVAPDEHTHCMAILMTRGDLPTGWPLELSVVTDPAADPSLKGKPGDPGPAGASVYELARAQGFSGTQAQWLASLVGPKGSDATDAQVAEQVAAWMAAHPITTIVGTARLTFTATVQIAAGVHDYVVALAGLAVGDALQLTPAAALPTGWAIHGAVVTKAGEMRLTVTTPLLAIGANVTIDLKVRRLNA